MVRSGSSFAALTRRPRSRQPPLEHHDGDGTALGDDRDRLGHHDEAVRVREVVDEVRALRADRPHDVPPVLDRQPPPRELPLPLRRVELLRAAGHSYRELESGGIFLVIAEVQVRYYLPALFDDVLRLVTTTMKAKGARIEHQYEISRGEELLVEGTTTVACVDAKGRPTRLPQWLRDLPH